MPTYDYICRNCDAEHEIFHGINAAPETVCPSCDAEALDKSISFGAGVIFKGSGFYETDYKRKPEPCKPGGCSKEGCQSK